MTEASKRTEEPKFNDLPIGTAVLAWPGSRDGRAIVTTTRSEPWELPAGDRVVMVEGYAGGIALTHIEVLPVAEHPPAEEVAEVAVEEREALAEALAPSLYEALMEAAHDSWRQWRYLNDRGRERHRARAAEIVADALLPAVAALTAKAKAEAFDEGMWAAYNVERDGGDGSEVRNPYREPR